MSYVYKIVGQSENRRAGQREIIDLIEQGTMLKVRKTDGYHWVDGRNYFIDGDEAFPDFCEEALDPYSSRTRNRILLLYTFWGIPTAMLIFFTGLGLLSIAPAPAIFVIIAALAWFFSIVDLWQNRDYAWNLALWACAGILLTAVLLINTLGEHPTKQFVLIGLFVVPAVICGVALLTHKDIILRDVEPR
ncbi:MAG: hypothetical protein AAF492_22620 [Verrucomicrobiota bacterium]